MFTCCIIDDDVTSTTLTGFISLVDHMTLVGVYRSPENLLDKFIATKPDLIFMDLDLAKKCPIDSIQFSNMASLILMGHNQMAAYEALELNAIDFLLKPIEYSSFLKTVIKSKKIRFRELEKSMKNLMEVKDHCFIKIDTIGKKIIKLKYDDIIMVEGTQNYITVLMEDCKHLAYLTMKELEENLPSEKFIRIHKSYIININKITAIDGNNIFLNDSIKLLVGSSYRTSFSQIINEKILRTKRYSVKPDTIEKLLDI